MQAEYSVQTTEVAPVSRLGMTTSLRCGNVWLVGGLLTATVTPPSVASAPSAPTLPRRSTLRPHRAQPARGTRWSWCCPGGSTAVLRCRWCSGSRGWRPPPRHPRPVSGRTASSHAPSRCSCCCCRPPPPRPPPPWCPTPAAAGAAFGSPPTSCAGWWVPPGDSKRIVLFKTCPSLQLL